jgi:restriction system protein
VARKGQSSPLEDLIEVMEFAFRYVPPWASIPVAAIAFLGISTWINSRLKTPGLEKLGYLLGGLVALAILIGGFGGYRYRLRQAAFLRQNITLDWVNSLSWQDFENLVGEIFRARDYAVENVGGGGADGGIDLRLRRQGETTLVQCKRWKVFKVGVRPIREFFGVMTSEGVDRGIFVSSGIYTNEALRFAEGKPLELIDGAQFAEMAKAFQSHRLSKEATSSAPVLADITPERPKCPTCGNGMVLRRSKTGKTIGQEFWGCSRFPKCRGTRPCDQAAAVRS